MKKKALKKTSRRLTAKQRDWCAEYERQTTFEVLSLEDYIGGELTWDEFKQRNISWFSDWSDEVVRSIERYKARCGSLLHCRTCRDY